MLSQTVEYALRAAVYLATREGVPATTEEVALRTQVPAAYLAKILLGLTRAGLVRSQRGVGGGATLAMNPAELTILQVVNAVEPIQRIRTCPLKLSTHGVRLCPLHRKMDQALAAVEVAFQSTTLAELIGDTTGSIPLCDESPASPRRRIPLSTKKK